MIRSFVSIAAGACLLGGCVYPYESAFETCDAEAGACYRYCEDAPDETVARSCRRGCEEEANRCFDDAYRVADYGASTYGPRPWYGSYGYWRPRYGYIFSFDYYDRQGRYYDPYYRDGYGRRGDRNRYDRRGDGRRGDGRRGDGRRGDGRRGDDRGRGGESPPPRNPPATPPRNPPATPVAPPPQRPEASPPPLRPRGPGQEPRKDD